MLTLPLYGLKPGPLTFSPDGRLLAVGGANAELRAYDLASGELLWHRPRRPAILFKGRPVFSPDGRQVARKGYPGERYDARTGRSLAKERLDWPPAVTSVHHHSPCGRWVMDARYHAISDLTGNSRISLTNRLACPPDARTPFPICESYFYTFCPSGELAASGRRHLLLVVRVADLLTLDAVEPTPVVTVASPRLPRRHWQDAAFTPDGSTLLAVSNEAVVRRWDTTTWAERPGYDFAVGPLKSVAVSPDGLRAAIAGTKRIAVWDLD